MVKWGRCELPLAERVHSFTCREQHQEAETTNYLVMCGACNTVYALGEGGGRRVSLAAVTTSII